MEGALFNPGFVGSHWLWWVGQVMPDKTWRENINQCNFKESSEIPGWGYRYKVRIMGMHDQDESIVPNDQLPWAQVMYPITAGTGQGGNVTTPGIRQGNFVFGFFLDGQDQQVPVIMGILGNNGKTEIPDLKQHIFAPSSAEAEADEDPTKKVADNNLSVVKKSPPLMCSVDSVHQRVAATVKTEDVQDAKHALACPDPEKNTDMKGIQTCMEGLSKDIAKAQKALQDLEGAAGLPIVEANKTIDQLIEGRAGEMTKFMGGIMGRVQQYTTDQYSNQLQQMLTLAPASAGLDLRILEVAGLEGIAGTFNGITDKIPGLLLGALKNAFKNKKSSSPSPSPSEPQLDPVTNPGAEIVPPLPQEGYYSPTPMCSTEEVIGEVVGSVLNEIMDGFDSAIQPPVTDAANASTAAGSSSGSKAAGSSPFGALAGLLQGGGLSSLMGGLGALKGMNFDINMAMGFIDNVSSFFPTDFKPECSPNDTHTMASGGSGKTKKQIPSLESVVNSAVNKKMNIDSLKGKAENLTESLSGGLIADLPKFDVPSLDNPSEIFSGQNIGRIAGTALGGPVGGVVGQYVGGTIAGEDVSVTDIVIDEALGDTPISREEIDDFLV